MKARSIGRTAHNIQQERISTTYNVQPTFVLRERSNSRGPGCILTDTEGNLDCSVSLGTHSDGTSAVPVPNSPYSCHNGSSGSHVASPPGNGQGNFEQMFMNSNGQDILQDAIKYCLGQSTANSNTAGGVGQVLAESHHNLMSNQSGAENNERQQNTQFTQHDNIIHNFVQANAPYSSENTNSKVQTVFSPTPMQNTDSSMQRNMTMEVQPEKEEVSMGTSETGITHSIDSQIPRATTQESTISSVNTGDTESDELLKEENMEELVHCLLQVHNENYTMSEEMYQIKKKAENQYLVCKLITK